MDKKTLKILTSAINVVLQGIHNNRLMFILTNNKNKHLQEQINIYNSPATEIINKRRAFKVIKNHIEERMKVYFWSRLKSIFGNDMESTEGLVSDDELINALKLRNPFVAYKPQRPENGKDVIKHLISLGGINKYGFKGADTTAFYFIDPLTKHIRVQQKVKDFYITSSY